MVKKKPKPSGWTAGRIAALSLAGGLLLLALFAQQGRRAPQPGEAQRPAPAPGGPAAAPSAADARLTIETVPATRPPVIADHEHLLDEREAERVLVAMDRLGIRKMSLMGTSKYTFTLNNRYGFEQFKENNETILRIAKRWPDRFLAFPTIFPPEASNLELLQDYVRRGAQGIKLYLGHGASTGKEPFHMMPLDDPRMIPIYRWAQETQLPLQFHVNFTKYHDEFVRVMEQFPYLRVCVPHFGLFKNNRQRLAMLGKLFERYPNFYSDISFGWYEFQTQAFEKFDKYPRRYSAYLEKYADRFMYSADMVVEPTKDEAYIINTLRSYLQVLEMPRYRYFLKPERVFNGLALSQDVLQRIYWDTPARYLILDEAGNPPDRSRGWPWPGWEGKAMPGLPPTVPEVQPLQTVPGAAR